MMKFKVVIFLIFITSYCVFAQKPTIDSTKYHYYISLRDSAEKCYINGNYLQAIQLYKEGLTLNENNKDGDFSLSNLAFCYMKADSLSQAITLYKKVYQLAKTKRFISPLALEYLGMCYTKMDSIPQAKAVFEIAVKSDYPLRDIPVYCCKSLADIYYKEKNYHRAISYYQLHSKLCKNAHFPDFNEFALDYSDAIYISHCYKGLKSIDSAINALTPTMFSFYVMLKSVPIRFPEKTDSKDSVKHDSICRDYLSLLLQRHSVKNIKQELKKADLGFHYVEEQLFYGPKDSLEDRIGRLKFTFFNVLVIFDTIWDVPYKKDVLIPENFKNKKREECLYWFRETPLYKMITAL